MKTVGRYELLRTIGRGGMATVYLARQTDLDRHVALKELRLFDSSEPELARRFLREARLAGSFSHPNIVTVHDYFEHDGRPYIAMEYMPRGPLRPYVGRLSLAQIGAVLDGMLSGLAHAEGRAIVHRDLKPENIMVSSQGSVKIADFGIAKAATSATQTSADLTTTGTTLGTPRYMAPERAMAQDVGPWSDLYSLGVIAWELVVGRTPFQDTDAPMAILMRQINDPIPAVSSVVPDVDPAFSDWIERLLVKDPAKRTRSASTARGELDELLVELVGAHWLREAGLPERPGGPPSLLSGTPGVAAREMRTPATVPMADRPEPNATVAPATVALDAEPLPVPGRHRRRRRVPPVARLMLLLGALVLSVAAIASGGGGQGAPTADTVGPSRAYATVLDGSVGGLERQARAHGNDLAAASTAQAKSRAAQTLASDYRAAATPLEGLALEPADRAANRRLVAALNQTSRAYEQAAAGAGRGDAAAFDAGLARAEEGQTAMDGALAGLQAAGYDAGAGSAAGYDAGAGSAAPPAGDAEAKQPADSGVGDSRSDDPSDDEPDEDDNGD